MPKYLLILCCLMVISACNQSTSSKKNSPDKFYFFDLAGYFGQEIKQLEQAETVANKKVRYNGQEDVLPQQKLNYEKELAVFIHSDINKLSWREKYSADTIRNGAEIRTITYKALDEQLKTRKIQIAFSQSQVAKINIQNRLKSIIANTWQELQYTPGKGYLISGKQNMRFAGEDTMGIEVEFGE